MAIRLTLCFLAALLAAGCSHSTEVPATLDGNWSHLSPTLTYNMELATDAAAIMGTGLWVGEACCSGTVAVHGGINAGVVDLDLDFVATHGGLQLPAPFTQHFTGRFVGSDSLDGVLVASDQVIPFGYHRTRSIVD